MESLFGMQGMFTVTAEKMNIANQLNTVRASKCFGATSIMSTSNLYALDTGYTEKLLYQFSEQLMHTAAMTIDPR